MSAKVVEPEVLTEVPATLKKLVRFIVRGFYEKEHALVIDLLVHHPCIKEEDLLELLKFEQKMLRTVINTLKNDKFIKVRMRMETNSEGRTNKHNYYFINYSTFVNVVKYKLDHIRRKIETEERNLTSRASFKCPNCLKTFTDLEAGQLFDPFTGEMKCTYCHTEVEEDSSVQPKTDARTLMVKFNEQIEPVFSLLREVEDIKLSQDLLEPEPMDIKGTRTSGGNRQPGDNSIWSGERRTAGFSVADSGVTISIEGEGQQAAAPTPVLKEQPIWMKQSTIKGAGAETVTNDAAVAGRSDDQPSRPADADDDIMRTLLAHEKKASAPKIPGAGPGPRLGAQSEDSSDSDSETEDLGKSKPAVAAGRPSEAMDTEGEDEGEVTVTVAGATVPYHEVTEEMVQRMAPGEREAYIRIGQEMYEDMYD